MALARQFGIVTVHGGTAAGNIAGILIQSLSISTAIEKATAKGEDGKTINVQAYSKSKTLSVQGLLNTDAGVTKIEAGDTIVISGTTFLVDSAEQAESNTDFTRYNLTISSEDGCVPVAYS